MPTLYSKRLDAHLHLGKNTARPLQNATSMDEVMRLLAKQGATLPALQTFNHASIYANGSVTAGGWGGGGNGPEDDNSIPAEYTAAKQGAGDCAIAGPGHEHMLEHKLSGNPGLVTFSCWRDLQNYATYTAAAAPGQGYDPKTGANDNGCDVSSVIKYRQETGLPDDQGVTHKIGQAIELTPGDLEHLWLASLLFQKVGFGISFRSNNMDEFDQGQPWTYDASASDEGGHYIFNCGYVLDGGPMGRLISWGEDVQWRRIFYIKQCDEAISYLSTDMYSTVTGKDSDGYADQDLELYLSAFVQKARLAGPRPVSFIHRALTDLKEAI